MFEHRCVTMDDLQPTTPAQRCEIFQEMKICPRCRKVIIETHLAMLNSKDRAAFALLFIDIFDELPEMVVRQSGIAMLSSQVKKIFSQAISFRESHIFDLIYGFDGGYCDYSVEEVAIIFKTSSREILKFKAKAIEKLKSPKLAVQLRNLILGTDRQ